MADMTFRQKKMKSAAGPHNLQRDDHSGNEYEQMHGAKEFFVVGDSYGSKPKDRGEPGDQTTPALNKDAEYNLGESKKIRPWKKKLWESGGVTEKEKEKAIYRLADLLDISATPALSGVAMLAFEVDRTMSGATAVQKIQAVNKKLRVHGSKILITLPQEIQDLAARAGSERAVGMFWSELVEEAKKIASGWAVSQANTQMGEVEDDELKALAAAKQQKRGTGVPTFELPTLDL